MARGSVFRRSGGWAYRVDAGFNPETGKRRQTLKQGFPTKKQAEAALDEASRDRSSGTSVVRSTIRVEEFLNEWLERQQSAAADDHTATRWRSPRSTGASAGTSCSR